MYDLIKMMPILGRSKALDKETDVVYNTLKPIRE